jgi:hypothetical protein
MITERLKNSIKNYLVELSGKSVGVDEFIKLIEDNPDLIDYLNFPNIEDIKEYILYSDFAEFDQLRSEASKYLKNKYKTLESEMDEIQRTVQDLNRENVLDISVDDLLNAFKKSKEITLDKKIWSKLENTESNQIKRGQFDKVLDLAKKYDKTNPNNLKNQLKSGEYKRPLILNFGDRYYLVAGNTRLSTAAAMGIKPRVYLASI